MKITHLFTIGYEQADFDDFLCTLQLLGVKTLVDIRELPMSRRRGFAKTALKGGLAEAGIQYRHEPSLGSPKAIRHRLREDHDYDVFFGDFAKHLASQGKVLDSLVSELQGKVALLCYERDYKCCHRALVADALAKRTGLRPSHKGVRHDVKREPKDSCSYFGQGLSTA